MLKITFTDDGWGEGGVDFLNKLCGGTFRFELNSGDAFEGELVKVEVGLSWVHYSVKDQRSGLTFARQLNELKKMVYL